MTTTENPYPPRFGANSPEDRDEKLIALEDALEALETVRSFFKALEAIEADHFVTFDQNGWFLEHPLACPLDGTLGTCDYHKAIRKVADAYEEAPDDWDRYRITNIDSEGLPSFERVGREMTVRKTWLEGKEHGWLGGPFLVDAIREAVDELVHTGEDD